MNFEMKFNKHLELTESDEKIYRGENGTGKFYIRINSDKLNNLEPITNYNYKLYVVFPDKSVIGYPLNFTRAGDGSYVDAVDITIDITDTAQTLKVFIRITKSDGTVGDTNTVDVGVYDIPDVGDVVPTRAEIDAASDELESILNGIYVPEENNGGVE